MLSSAAFSISGLPIQSGCEGKVSITKEGVIQSLNYGIVNEYAKNLDCQWLITAPSDKVQWL